MVWSTVHDEMLCREILVVDPFTGTKKGTVARGTKWEEVAENLNKIEQVYFNPLTAGTICNQCAMPFLLKTGIFKKTSNKLKITCLSCLNLYIF